MIKQISRKLKPKKIKTDDNWIRENFEYLIDNFPGQYLIVAEGEPFIGPRSKVLQLERKAQKAHPGVVTTGMPIPRPKDLISVL